MSSPDSVSSSGNNPGVRLPSSRPSKRSPSLSSSTQTTASGDKTPVTARKSREIRTPPHRPSLQSSEAPKKPITARVSTLPKEAPKTPITDRVTQNLLNGKPTKLSYANILDKKLEKILSKKPSYTPEGFSPTFELTKNASNAVYRHKLAKGMAQDYQKKAGLASNAEQKEQLEHLSNIAALVAKRQNRFREIGKALFGKTAAAATAVGVLGLGLAEGLVIGGAAGSLIAISTTGVGVGVPLAAAMGFALYKAIKHVQGEKNKNFWECTLHAASGKDTDLASNKHYQRATVKLQKQNKSQEDITQTEIKQHAFNQCLRNNDDFAVNYLIEALKDEATTAQKNGPAHALLEQLGIGKEDKETIDTLIKANNDPGADKILRGCLGLSAKKSVEVKKLEEKT